MNLMQASDVFTQASGRAAYARQKHGRAARADARRRKEQDDDEHHRCEEDAAQERPFAGSRPLAIRLAWCATGAERSVERVAGLGEARGVECRVR